MKTRLIILSAVLSLSTLTACANNSPANTNSKIDNQQVQPVSSDGSVQTLQTVVINTSMGDITVELYPDSAPNTVQNFLSYVNAGFYENTTFHRVIDGFMVQGGGFDATSMTEKATQPPIAIESNNGLKNLTGTIAMARTNKPNSATSQFFINVVDNNFLNAQVNDDGSLVRGKEGYTVFGKVISGMDTVNAIKAVNVNGSVPADNVVITHAHVVEEK